MRGRDWARPHCLAVSRLVSPTRLSEVCGTGGAYVRTLGGVVVSLADRPPTKPVTLWRVLEMLFLSPSNMAC